jgi:iron complex transport system substrate-binding protein
VTEILFALGLDEQIVATDTSSLYPIAATRLPKIGYYRQLSTEGVLSTQAKTLFAASGAGPEGVIRQLRQVGVKTHVFKQEKSLEGLYHLIGDIGEQANKTLEAKALQKKIANELEQLPGLSGKELRPVFLMSANERGLMAAGRNTVPHLIMTTAGARNPFSEIQGYKTVSLESFLSIAPTHVFIPAHQTGCKSAKEMCAQPALSKWASKHGCHVYIVDSLLFLGLGPRLPQAVTEFVNIAENKTPNASSKTLAQAKTEE